MGAKYPVESKTYRDPKQLITLKMEEQNYRITVPEKINSLIQLKTITTDKINSAIDKEVTFYCSQCEQQKFVVIAPEGSITCPDCGLELDLSHKVKAVTLTQKSRLKLLLNDLFQLGRGADEYFIDTFERYADSIGSSSP